MTRLNPVVIIGIAVAVLFAGSGASEPAKEDPRQKKRDIRKLLEVTGAGNLGKQVMDQMMAAMKPSMPDVPDEFWTAFAKETDMGELIEEIVPIYDKHLSHDDIKASIAFYETPAGRRIIKALPKITHESMLAGQKWGQRIAFKAITKLRAQKARPKDKPDKPSKDERTPDQDP